MSCWAESVISAGLQSDMQFFQKQPAKKPPGSVQHTRHVYKVKICDRMWHLTFRVSFVSRKYDLDRTSSDSPGLLPEQSIFPLDIPLG